MALNSQNSYRIVELPPLKGAYTSCAGMVNPKNLTVGYSIFHTPKGDREQGTIWKNHQPIAVGPSGSRAVGINSLGVAIGYQIDSSTAWYWVANKTHFLKCDKAKTIEVHGINDSGDMVGTYTDSNNEYHLAVWHEGKLDQELSKINAIGYSINNGGVLAGAFYGKSKDRWITKGLKLTLKSRKSTTLSEGGYTINNWDVIASGPPLAKCTDDQVWRFDGGDDTVPMGINSSGWMVGFSGFGSDRQACLVTDKLLMLSDLVAEKDHWSLEIATSINDSGIIVGSGQHYQKTRAYMLIPR